MCLMPHCWGQLAHEYVFPEYSGSFVSVKTPRERPHADAHRYCLICLIYVALRYDVSVVALMRGSNLHKKSSSITPGFVGSYKNALIRIKAMTRAFWK